MMDIKTKSWTAYILNIFFWSQIYEFREEILYQPLFWKIIVVCDKPGCSLENPGKVTENGLLRVYLGKDDLAGVEEKCFAYQGFSWYYEYFYESDCFKVTLTHT